MALGRAVCTGDTINCCDAHLTSEMGHSHVDPLPGTSDRRPAHPFSVDTMLLLTDGSIMCHELETSNWHKLVPNSKGNYVNGTWHAITPLPANAPLSQNGPVDAPLYYASAVLKDGRVFVAGGEYNVSSQVDLLTAEVYDPEANSWAAVPTPPTWNNIGDAPSCVLPDGKVLLGDINSTRTAIFDPITKTWSLGGNRTTKAPKRVGRCFRTIRSCARK